MRVSSIALKNIRGFQNLDSIEFSKGVNILIGANNSGKTTILRSILCLQTKSLDFSDVTVGRPSGEISIDFEEPMNYLSHTKVASSFWAEFKPQLIVSLSNNEIRRRLSRKVLRNVASATYNHYDIDDATISEPFNVIYPYLSKRKVTGYSEDVRLQASNSITGNFINLYAKIDRVSNPDFLPANKEYREACEKILGFNISSVPSDGGKRAAFIVRNLEHIPLASMGEGVANLLGLIVDLCVAENKIFLIEEPENDIHPRALKALLQLIEKKSESNQFIISTHSNIVTKYLGSVPNAKLFNVKMSFEENSRLPQSSMTEVGSSTQERQQVLEDLGYEFHDYDLWKAWLFLEESSAEEFVRDILIPIFASKLKNKLRTYSARTVSEIDLKFKDFNNLFVFLHLSPTYKNKAWVLVDGGETEKDIINKMKDYYVKENGWNEENFIQFKNHDFEKYYPEFFMDKIEATMAISGKRERNAAKSELLKEVKQWCSENPEKAKESLAVSAKEVIDILKSISKQIS